MLAANGLPLQRWGGCCSLRMPTLERVRRARCAEPPPSRSSATQHSREALTTAEEGGGADLQVSVGPGAGSADRHGPAGPATKREAAPFAEPIAAPKMQKHERADATG